MTREKFDAIIVGGSYAGLSAAMALARSLRRVLIIDAGEPCNAPTPHSHNFLTQDGKTPREIFGIAKEQVLAYSTVRFMEDFVVSAVRAGDGFEVETRSNGTFTSTTLLLATGVKDVLPAIPGLEACWGKSVLHCPYCHGYEVSGKKLAVVAGPDAGAEFVPLILNLSKNVVLLTNGEPSLKGDVAPFFRSLDVPVITTPIAEIVHNAGQVEKVTFADGESVVFDALFARVSFTHHSDIAQSLGCTFTESNRIAIDEQFGRTSVEGVFAAGDCTTLQRTVSIAVAGGTKAGVGINTFLVAMKTKLTAQVG